MNIRCIEAIDFLSYEHFEYVFKPISILVQGINRTDPNQESNGTGKTGFQAAIEYLLYGNTSQKIRDKDLIRFGCSEATLKGEIQCPVRKDTLKIERTIRRSGNSQLKLSVNDKPLHIATVIDGNQFITAWIGISKEDMQNYYIINNKRYRSFFNSSNTDKIQIISRFSNAHLVNDVLPGITTTITELEDRINVQNLEKAHLQGAVDSLNHVLENISSESFESNKARMLTTLDDLITEKVGQHAKVLASINATKISLKEHDVKILNIQSSIKETKASLDEIDIDQYKEQIDRMNEKIGQLRGSEEVVKREKNIRRARLENLERTLSRINRNLLASVQCPQCKFEFFPGDEFADVQFERGKKTKTEKIIDVLKENLEHTKLKISNIDDLIQLAFENKAEYQTLQDQLNSKVRSIQSVISDYNLELNQIESAKKMALSTIHDYENMIEFIDKNIANAKQEYERTEKSKYDKKEEASYRNKLKQQKRLIEDCDEKLLDLNQKLTNAKNWVLNFKAFKGYLANQFLQIIEGLCNQHLVSLKSDIQVKWEGYKTKADGTISEKITPYIIRQGEERDFNSFSGGERARMEFALILTIRELINKTHPYGGLNFMFADEIFEGLDGLGLSHMMKAIRGFNYPILITTHVTDSNLYSDILTVVKENGISRLYEKDDNRV